MKSFINFRIPKLSYKELIGTGKNRDNSPLLHIDSFLAERKSLHIDASAKKYLISELRVWACALYYYLERKKNKKTRMMFAESECAEQHGPSAMLRQGYRNLRSVQSVLKAWTETLHRVRSYESGNTEIFKETYILEIYVAMLIRDHISSSWQEVKDRAYLPILEKEYQKFTRLLRWYCHRNQLPWIDANSTTIEKETYVYEKAELKKMIWSSLYIDTRTQTSFKLRRQLGPMLAAGFAGLWAVMIDIFVIRNERSAGNVINLSTMIIVLLLVLAYILKDRIKEMGRSRFKSGLFGHLPDNNSVLYYDSGHFKAPVAIGRYTEKAYYSSIDSLPPDVLQHLSLATTRRSDYICYSKTLRVSPSKLDRFDLKIRGIYDFFRLNLAPMMFFIENSSENVSYVTQDGSIKTEAVPKVYKLDIIFAIKGLPLKKRDTYFQRFRVTLSKQKIVRVVRIPNND